MSPKDKTQDPILADGKETDIVIPIMGATGAGKSSFINCLLEGRPTKDLMKVGHELTSCTKQLSSVVLVLEPKERFPGLQGNRVVIVDTPGFDDTYTGDLEILQRIARWLELSYKKRMVLGGVIYLHDISQDRFSGTAKKNLEMFHVLCGNAALRKVVLATTKWNRLQEEHGKNREKELKAIHWQSLVKNGAQVHPFRGSCQNAWAIIDLFLKQAEPSTKPGIRAIVLQIQKEMVDARKIIPQTKAGKKLRYSLEELLNLQRRVAALEAELAKSGSTEAQAKLQETEENMQNIVGQIQVLRTSLPQRVLRLFRVLASEQEL